MRNRRGFTMIELLAVLAILATLAALLQPVIAKSRDSAHVQNSVSRLRQLAMAVQIYRSDSDLQGYSVNQFPPRDDIYENYLGFGIDFFRSPCGYKDGIESNLQQISYNYVPFKVPVIEKHLTTYREEALLFLDPHCNTVTQWESAFMTKRKLGVLVSGRIVNELAIGSTTRLEWWLPSGVALDPYSGN